MKRCRRFHGVFEVVGFTSVAVLATACASSAPAPTPPRAPTVAAAPPTASPAKFAPSSDEIPVENVEGALSGGDFDRGMAALDNGDLETAQAAYQRIHDRDPKEGSAFLLFGRIHEKQGDVAGAESAYREAVRLRADLEAAYVDLSALLAGQKRTADALASTRDGLTRFPSSAALHVAAATALATQGDRAGASAEFDGATRAASNDPTVLLTYAHWLRTWNSGDLALSKLRAARTLTRDVGLLAAIGEEMKALGAFSDCVPTFDQALRVKDAPEFRTYRAVCKLGAQDAAGARADLQAAIDAQYAPAHFYLARLLSDGGDWAGAVAEYETFLKLEPNVPASKVAREKLRQAKEHARRLTLAR